MTTPNMIILYVADARRAAAFWSDLVGAAPIELSDTFAMLPLNPATRLGLWGIAGVEPSTTICGGGGEIAIAVSGPAEVDAAHAAWVAAGRTILQPPTAMDFGRTFTAADPDGHRIRVFCPAEG